MHITQSTIINDRFKFMFADVPFIESATIRPDIKKGETFDIQFDGGTFKATWPHDTPVHSDHIGLAAPNLQRVIEAVKATELYNGVTTDSNAFYDAAANAHNKCKCDEPSMNDPFDVELIGCDLDTPDFPRQSSRLLVYVGVCSKCKLPLTCANSFAGYSITGAEQIKNAAQIRVSNLLSKPINWKQVATNQKAFKKVRHG